VRTAAESVHSLQASFDSFFFRFFPQMSVLGWLFWFVCIFQPRPAVVAPVFWEAVRTAAEAVHALQAAYAVPVPRASFVDSAPPGEKKAPVAGFWHISTVGTLWRAIAEDQLRAIRYWWGAPLWSEWRTGIGARYTVIRTAYLSWRCPSVGSFGAASMNAAPDHITRCAFDGNGRGTDPSSLLRLCAARRGFCPIRMW
jgi:hypothetical protein